MRQIHRSWTSCFIYQVTLLVPSQINVFVFNTLLISTVINCYLDMLICFMFAVLLLAEAETNINKYILSQAEVK